MEIALASVAVMAFISYRGAFAKQTEWLRLGYFPFGSFSCGSHFRSLLSFNIMWTLGCLKFTLGFHIDWIFRFKGLSMKAFINTFDFIGWRLGTYFFIGVVGLSFVSVGGIVDSFMDSLKFIFLSLLALNSFFAFSFREKQFCHLIFISKQLI